MARVAGGDEDLTGTAAKSLNKALDILTTLGKVPEGMNLADIALMVKQPKTTAHRLLTTLEARHFVRYEPAERLWKIGIEAFVVGSAFLRNRDLVEIARPILAQLMADTGESASFYIEDEGEIVCLTQVETRHSMRVIARPGGRARIHSSGSGKAILAHRPSAHVDAVIKRHGLDAATEKTLTTPYALRRNLEEVRAHGFAYDDEENALGIRCVAAPVFDHTGEVAGAISISGPSSRVTAGLLDQLGQRVHESAQAMTAAIGGPKQPHAEASKLL